MRQLIALATLLSVSSAYGQPQSSEGASDSATDSPSREQTESRFAGMVRLGLAYRQVHAIPITGLDGGVRIGRQIDPLRLMVGVDGFYGETEHGLEVRELRFVGRLSHHTDAPFWFGGEAALGRMWVSRYTESEDLVAHTLQLGPVVGFDLVRPSADQALAIEVSALFTLDDFHPGFDLRGGLAYHF
jgi:hypothetical protein